MAVGWGAVALGVVSAEGAVTAAVALAVAAWVEGATAVAVRVAATAG